MDDVVRLGIVGCAEGTHGRVWAEMLCSPGGEAFGMAPAKVWDADPEAAESLAAATGAVAVDAPSDAGEGVDGILIAELFPERYLELSRPFLEAGRRVFFNRPFAGSTEDAGEIIRLARRNGARIYSASALFHTQAAVQAKAQLADVSPLRLFTVTGPTDHMYFYLPHAIAAMVSVLGTGVARVQTTSMHIDPRDSRRTTAPLVVYVEYAEDSLVGPARGVIQMLGPGSDWYAFDLKLFGASRDAEPVRFEVSYDMLLRSMARFFRTGEEPVPHEVMLEKTAVFYAALESAGREGRMIDLGKGAATWVTQLDWG